MGVRLFTTRGSPFRSSGRSSLCHVLGIHFGVDGGDWFGGGGQILLTQGSGHPCANHKSAGSSLFRDEMKQSAHVLVHFVFFLENRVDIGYYAASGHP